MVDEVPAINQDKNGRETGVPQQALNALDGLFATHEIRVLGVVGILTGYLCILFVKMVGFFSPLIGVAGVAVLAQLLLFLDPKKDTSSMNWWLRDIAVIIVSIVITSPQLYDAWTVAVQEKQNAELAKLGAQPANTWIVQGEGKVVKDTEK